MFLSAVSALVVALPSLEVPEASYRRKVLSSTRFPVWRFWSLSNVGNRIQ
jgi:hypothetical protein